MKVSHPAESKGNWSILGDRIERLYPKKAIGLTDNVDEIKVFHHSEASEAVAGRDGLPRAAAGAVLGFLIAGPVGTVLGAGAGASGAKAGQSGRSENYSITLTFKNHQYLIGDVSSSELELLRGFLEAPAAKTTDLVERKATKPASLDTAFKAQIDLYAALPEPIRGRTTKQKIYPVAKISERLGSVPDSQGIALFFRHLQAALDALNTIKWRYYDREVDNDLEIAQSIAVALSAASHQTHQLSTLSGSADEVLESLVTYFAPLISELEVRKAWSKPKPSSVITKAGALKIFKKCRSFDPQYKPSVKQGAAKGKNNDAESNGNEIEQRLASLKNLLKRGVISEDEYRAARHKTLGI